MCIFNFTADFNSSEKGCKGDMMFVVLLKPWLMYGDKMKFYINIIVLSWNKIEYILCKEYWRQGKLMYYWKNSWVSLES